MVKNCLLIACALENWEEAENWFNAGETTLQSTLVEVTRRNDTLSLRALALLREELDEVNEFRMEDLTGMTKEERDEAIEEDDVDCDYDFEPMTDYDEDLAGIEDAEAVAKAGNKTEVTADQASSEDTKTIAEAENRMEVAAEHICIPIRSSNPVPSDTNVSTCPLSAVSETKNEHNTATDRKPHRQKSAIFSKGGAFHTQQFTKFIGPAQERSTVIPDTKDDQLATPPMTAKDSPVTLDTLDNDFDYLLALAPHMPQSERERYKKTISKLKRLAEKALIERNRTVSSFPIRYDQARQGGSARASLLLQCSVHG